MANRITQTRLAHELGYSTKWVSMVLNQQVPAPAAFRARTARLLGMPESELFFDDPIADAAAALVQRTRLAQGLDAQVTDPAVLRAVAAVLELAADRHSVSAA